MGRVDLVFLSFLTRLNFVDDPFRIADERIKCLSDSKSSVWDLVMEDIEDFSVDSVVQGHHIYKSLWTPRLGEVLPAEVEEGNEHGQCAVAVCKNSIIVSHIPRELSRTFYFFLRHGGSIECKITGDRRKGLGLEVPCLYTLSGKPRYIKRLVKLLSKPKKQDRDR